ncbi:hypothetical protein RUND412_000357 [Rhizina undulata]
MCFGSKPKKYEVPYVPRQSNFSKAFRKSKSERSKGSSDAAGDVTGLGWTGTSTRAPDSTTTTGYEPRQSNFTKASRKPKSGTRSKGSSDAAGNITGYVFNIISCWVGRAQALGCRMLQQPQGLVGAETDVAVVMEVGMMVGMEAGMGVEVVEDVEVAEVAEVVEDVEVAEVVGDVEAEVDVEGAEDVKEACYE